MTLAWMAKLEKILISISQSDVDRTALENREHDFTSLCKTLNAPKVGNKGGSYFIRCQGTKRNTADTSDTASIIILDGDSRIGDGGEILRGAPDPKLIHEALKELGWQHLIYSSHSNGATKEELEAKGINSGGAYGENYHKYRVLIPCQYTPEQLPALLNHIFKELHTRDIMLEPANENKAWAQAWYFPRVPDENRKKLFRFYSEKGTNNLDIPLIVNYWETMREKTPEPAAFKYTIKHTGKNGGDAIQSFNQSYRVTEILANSGYIQRGNKWLRPDSTSKIPAVQVCQNCNDGIERVYSHGGDILNDGHAHDAFDCYRLLQCGGDWKRAFQWDPNANKSRQREYMKEQAKISQAPAAATSKTTTQEPAPVTTYNATLDTEQNYCKVDLLRHLDDQHLLKRLSRYVAELTHLPANTVMLIGMTAYSSMAARKYAVLYQNKKQLPIGLYAVAEQPSGTGKTWCINTFIDPFREIQKAALDRTNQAIKRIEKKAEGLAREAGHLDDSEKEELKELKGKAKRLKAGLFFSNATPEGLETTLEHTGGFFSAVASEQGLFTSLFGGSYKAEGRANNNDMVLNGFDGGYVNGVRVSRESFHGHVVGSVACFAQPGTIETVLKASNGTGLSERFLMLAELHMLGLRDHTKWPEPQPTLEHEYSKACEFIGGILDEPRSMEDLSSLIISKAGFLKINQYRNRIEPHLADGGKYSHISLRGAASKINMQIMKIAATLHLLDDGQYQPEINDKHIDAAIEIANELLEANLKLCQDKGILGVKAEYTAVINYLSRPGAKPIYSAIKNSLRNTQPFKDHTGNKAELIEKTLDEMTAQGLLTRQVDGGKISFTLR